MRHNIHLKNETISKLRHKNNNNTDVICRHLLHGQNIAIAFFHSMTIKIRLKLLSDSGSEQKQCMGAIA